MKIDRVLRIGGLVLVLVVLLLVMLLLLSVTDATLGLWERLTTAPALLRYGFVAALAALAGLFFWLTWRVLRRPAPAQSTPAPLLDEDAIKARVSTVGEDGVDTEAAEQALADLAQHRAGESLIIALFGAVSTGKSSLAKALLPDADVLISPVAGSTVSAARYEWQARTGATITLADLPGLEAVGGELDSAMLEEARRAHAVVFVTDGDLSRQQVAALQLLRAQQKPLIVTLNKADQYAPDELQTIIARLQTRLATESATEGVAPTLIVTIAGGEYDAKVMDQSGESHTETRVRDADISQLVLALEEMLGRDLGAINALREQALLQLAADKLQEAEQRYREQRAEQIVRTATRRAVIGALAAVTPGTDVVIQGYLGTQMTQSLCKLYGHSPRDLEIERFLDLSQSRVGKALPLSLAIAGNALKAFPGVGTLAGGATHAVAYGLLFDAVGRGLAVSLAEECRFDAEVAAQSVQKGLDEHLEQSVRRVARLALEAGSNSE
ncbi:MAG: GTPase [Pseudomonadota bacterium]